MDLVIAALQKLQQTRHERLDLMHERYSGQDFGELTNVIADVINLLEQFYVLATLPADGFVSITPERPGGQEETSTSDM